MSTSRRVSVRAVEHHAESEEPRPRRRSGSRGSSTSPLKTKTSSSVSPSNNTTNRTLLLATGSTRTTFALQAKVGIDPTKEVRADTPDKALSPDERREQLNLPQEIPEAVRHEWYEAPEERAHQGHRSLHRPLEGSPKHFAPVNSESVFEKYAHTSGGIAIDNEDDDDHHRKQHPGGVLEGFTSPYAIRAKDHSTLRSLDEVLNDEGDYVTLALKRANAAHEQQERARALRKEINERCYADITNCVGAVLNRKQKKKLGLLDAKSRGILYRPRISSDLDTSSSDEAGSGSGGGGTSSDSSSIDLSDASSSNVASQQRNKRKRRRRGGRFRHESRLNEILDIVDSINYYDYDEGDRGRAGSISSLLDDSSIFDSTVMSASEGDLLEETSTVPDSEDRSTPAESGDDITNKLGTAVQTLKASKKLKQNVAKKLYKERKEAEALAAAHATSFNTAGKPRQKTAAQKKLEMERLAEMRKQLQAKREEREGLRKEAGRSNWFKKAIHVRKDRAGIHPLRTGTYSPSALEKLQDVQFADEQSDDDLVAKSEKELEDTLHGAGLHQDSKRPSSQATRPDSSATIAERIGDDDENSSERSRSENSEDERTRWELAEQAARAAKSILISDDSETCKAAPNSGVGLLNKQRRASLLPAPEDQPGEAGEMDMMDDNLQYDEATGEWLIVTPSTVFNPDKPTKKVLLDMARVDGCPNIFLVQEKSSRLESAVDVSVVNRSTKESGAQWLLIDFSKCDGMDVRTASQLAQVAPEKHLLCSTAGHRSAVAKMVKQDGGASDAALKRAIDVMPVSTEEALVLRSSLTRLATSIAGKFGKHKKADQQEVETSTPTTAEAAGTTTKSGRQLGATAIEMFLSQRTEEKEREQQRAARRSMLKEGKHMPISQVADSKTQEQLLHDKELKAVVDDAVAENPGIDANTLLVALELLRARQHFDRELTKDNKKPQRGSSDKTGQQRSQQEEEEIENAQKALMKSYRKIQKEKQSQKAAEKAERDRAAKEKRDRERASRTMANQLKQFDDIKRKEAQDRELNEHFGTEIDKKRLADFIAQNSSGAGGKSKLDKKKRKQLEEEFKRREAAEAAAKMAASGDETPSSLTGTARPDGQRPVPLDQSMNNNPFVRPQLTAAEREEDERLRREYLEEKSSSGRSSSHPRSAGGSRPGSELMPAPSMSAEYEQQLQKQQQGAIEGGGDTVSDLDDTINDGSLPADGRNRRVGLHDAPVLPHAGRRDSGAWGGLGGSKRGDATPPGSPPRPPSLGGGKQQQQPAAGGTSVVVGADNVDLDQAALAFGDELPPVAGTDNKGRTAAGASPLLSTSKDNVMSNSARGDRLVGGGKQQQTSGTAAVKGPDRNAASVRDAIRLANRQQGQDGKASTTGGGGSPKKNKAGEEVSSIQQGINNRVFGFDLTPRKQDSFRRRKQEQEEQAQLEQSLKDARRLQQRRDKEEGSPILTADEYLARDAANRADSRQSGEAGGGVIPVDRGLSTTPTSRLGAKDFVDYGGSGSSPRSGDVSRRGTLAPHGEDLSEWEDGGGDDTLLETAGDVAHAPSHSPVFDGSVRRGMYDTLIKPASEGSAASPDGEGGDEHQHGAAAGGEGSPPPAPPADFVQNPALSDAILSSAFDRALLVAMQEGQTDRNKLLNILERDTGSSDHHHHHRHHTGDGMWRSTSRNRSEEAAAGKYKPPTRPPVSTADDIRKSYQSKVRDAILSSDVDRESGASSAAGEKAGEEGDGEGGRRPGTADAIRDLVRDHLDLTTALRSELGQLARMMRSTNNPNDIAALRKAIIVTAWKYQHGREINLRKLILLLERKVHHRKWLPYVMNENVFTELDGGMASHSARMYGGWLAPKDRVVTGMMFPILSFVSGTSDIHSIPTYGEGEGLELLPGHSAITLVPRPPRSARMMMSSGKNGRRIGSDVAAAQMQQQSRRRRPLPPPTKFAGVLRLDKSSSAAAAAASQNDPTLAVFAFAGSQV